MTPNLFIDHGTVSRGKMNLKTNHHVGVPYSLHFVDVVAPDDPVEHRVQVVEEVDHLQGRALGRHGGEAHDVAEVYRDGVEGLGLHALARRQPPRHRPTTTAGRQSPSAHARS